MSNSGAAPPKSWGTFPPLNLPLFLHLFFTPFILSHLFLFQHSPSNTFLRPCLDLSMDSFSDFFADILDLLTPSHLARQFPSSWVYADLSFLWQKTKVLGSFLEKPLLTLWMYSSLQPHLYLHCHSASLFFYYYYSFSYILWNEPQC